MTDTTTVTEEQKEELEALAEGIKSAGGRKYLKAVAKGINKTEEGRKLSGSKYFTQRLVFKAMAGEITDNGSTAEEAVEKFDSLAKANKSVAKEAAEEEMGGLSTLFEEL